MTTTTHEEFPIGYVPLIYRKTEASSGLDQAERDVRAHASVEISAQEG